MSVTSARAHSPVVAPTTGAVCRPMPAEADIVDDIARVRPGDHVRLYYVCRATLSGVAKPAVGGGLVLDIPGDNFMVRLPDGRHEDGVEKVVILDRP